MSASPVSGINLQTLHSIAEEARALRQSPGAQTAFDISITYADGRLQVTKETPSADPEGRRLRLHAASERICQVVQHLCPRDNPYSPAPKIQMHEFRQLVEDLETLRDATTYRSFDYLVREVHERELEAHGLSHVANEHGSAVTAWLRSGSSPDLAYLQTHHFDHFGCVQLAKVFFDSCVQHNNMAVVEWFLEKGVGWGAHFSDTNFAYRMTSLPHMTREMAATIVSGILGRQNSALPVFHTVVSGTDGSDTDGMTPLVAACCRDFPHLDLFPAPRVADFRNIIVKLLKGVTPSLRSAWDRLCSLAGLAAPFDQIFVCTNGGFGMQLGHPKALEVAALIGDSNAMLTAYARLHVVERTLRLVRLMLVYPDIHPAAGNNSFPLGLNLAGLQLLRETHLQPSLIKLHPCPPGCQCGLRKTISNVLDGLLCSTDPAPSQIALENARHPALHAELIKLLFAYRKANPLVSVEEWRELLHFRPVCHEDPRRMFYNALAEAIRTEESTGVSWEGIFPFASQDQVA